MPLKCVIYVEHGVAVPQGGTAVRLVAIFVFIAVVWSQAFADMASFDPSDPRLEKKVTLEVDHTKLEDALKQLSADTGVELKAGSGERDWKVRERRVTIHAKDVSLGKLMEEISKLLQFRLSRGGKEGEWTYLYWQDKTSRDLEADLLAADKEAAAQRATKLRQGTLDAAEKALELSPEEAAKLREKDPMLAYMGGTKSGRGFAQVLSSLGSYFPTERDLMLRGKQVTLNLAGAPSAFMQAVIDTAAGGIVAGQAMRQDADKFKQLLPYQMVMMPIDQADGMDLGLLGIGGLILVSGLRPGEEARRDGNPFGGGEPMSLFVLGDPASPLGKTVGKMFFAVDEGATNEEANKVLQDEVENQDFLAKALARESPTEKEPPTDPELTREVEISEDIKFAKLFSPDEDGKEKVGMSVAEISRALGMPVMLESFPRLVPPAAFLKPGKQPVYNILIAMEKAGCGWERGDKSLRVRPKDWALRRSYEVPESFTAHYKDLLEKQGGFTLDDLATIAYQLTDGQIDNTVMTDRDLSPAVMSLSTNLGERRGIVRIYGSLNPEQKAGVSSETGLPFAQLSNAQWELLGDLITQRLGGLYVLDGSIRLEPQSKAVREELAAAGATYARTFQITVQVAGEEKPRVVAEHVMIVGKAQIKAMREARERARQAAEQAAKAKEKAAQPKPEK